MFYPKSYFLHILCIQFGDSFIAYQLSLFFSQKKFTLVRSNNKTGMDELVQKLNNKHDLSILIHAIGYDVDETGEKWIRNRLINILYVILYLHTIFSLKFQDMITMMLKVTVSKICLSGYCFTIIVSLFLILKIGWFDASNSNVCYITYAFAGSVTTLKKLLPHMRNMVDTKRFIFVARQARDLVLNVKAQKNSCITSMKQIVMVII